MIMFSEISPDTPAGWIGPALSREISNHNFYTVIIFKFGGTIVSVNLLAKFKYGYQAFKFLELHMEELIPKCNYYPDIFHTFTPTVGPSQFMEIEDIEILRKEGSYFSSLLQLILLYSPYQEFLGEVFGDVANYKPLQHTLFQKTTKLETITCHLEHFLYNASYELRALHS
jgi:hypothetical protein